MSERNTIKHGRNSRNKTAPADGTGKQHSAVMGDGDASELELSTASSESEFTQDKAAKTDDDAA